jgi:hypothetical protein
MPRYHFHFRDGAGLNEDSKGVELPNLKAAYAEALRRARHVLQRLGHWPPDFREEMAHEMAFEIADETGQRVLTVPFSDATGPTH